MCVYLQLILTICDSTTPSWKIIYQMLEDIILSMQKIIYKMYNIKIQNYWVKSLFFTAAINGKLKTSDK